MLTPTVPVPQVHLAKSTESPRLRADLVVLPHQLQMVRLSSPVAKSLEFAWQHAAVIAVIPPAPSLKLQREIVSLVRVAAISPPLNGRSAVLLRGCGRGRLVTESALGFEVLQEGYDAPVKHDRLRMRQSILREFRLRSAAAALGPGSLRWLEEHLPLGAVCDVISHATGLCIDAQRRILGEPNVDQRCELLLAELDAHHRWGQHELPLMTSHN